MAQPREREAVEQLRALWIWFADTQFAGYSPLYDRIGRAVADDDELLGRIQQTPSWAHLPLSLLGAVHFLVRRDPGEPLAAVYAGVADEDPAPRFLDLCRRRWDEVATRMSVRGVQTNECGRATFLGPALSWLAAVLPGPLAFVDVGTSAGLNLRTPSYRLDYGAAGATGPADSPVVAHCEVLGGTPPIPRTLAPFAARLGLDRDPVDVNVADDADWLLACTWPDTGRLDRTAAALSVARADPVPIERGDAVDDLPRVLALVPDDAIPVVVTTYVVGYFTVEARARLAETLADAGRSRPVVWLCADGAGVVADVPDGLRPDARAPDVLSASRFDGGHRTDDLVATVHPHGAALHWLADGG